jgi:hypothetical protein
VLVSFPLRKPASLHWAIGTLVVMAVLLVLTRIRDRHQANELQARLDCL